MGRQLAHVMRRLLRSPLFTGVTLITLAVSIGANTAIFAVVEGVLLKPLPYPDPERLTGVWMSAPGLNIPDLNMSPSNYFTFIEENKSFQDFGLWNTGSAGITGLAEPEQVRILNVTHRLLPALGIQPVAGRWFTESDDTPGNPETVILAYSYWQRKFGGDPSAIGRRIMVSSRAREIVGVMPQDFRFLDQRPELILPFQFDRSKVFLGNFSYQGIARLKPGVTLEQANTDVGRMIPMAYSRFPPPPGFSARMFEDAGIVPNVRPLKVDVIGDIGKVLWVLMATIGIVMLIACANVANLLLVRAEGRQQELAVRAALGAGWSRIAGELLLESVFLGLIGGAFGAGLAYAGLKLLVAAGPSSLPRLDSISIDPAVLLFTLAVSLVTSFLFGLVPVLKYAGPHLAGGLRTANRTVSHSRERHRARNALVVVQIALALVLLISSGLMIRTFSALRHVQPGFTRPAEIQTFRISIPEALVKEPERVTRMQQDILDRIKQLPGVENAAFANGVPLDGNNSNDLIYTEDRTYTDAEIPPIRRFRWVAPGYFQTIGNPLIAGRDLEWTDLYEKRQVAIISENMARELWGNPGAAIGKRIRQTPSDPWREIVGVVGNLYEDGVDKKAPAMVYWPMLIEKFWGNETYVSRSAAFVIRNHRVDTESFLKEVREAVWSVNSNLPVAGVRSLDDIYQSSMARTSFTLVMLGIAGGMALLLGVVGIYGVMSYAVSQRTREIGVRMALGAQQQHVKRMFLGHGLVLAAVGAVFGIAASIVLMRMLSSLLFEVSPVDPLTYGSVTAGLIAAAAVASYLPARRATTIDPIEALRIE